jgi:sugar/nucleoside kinase (ribokinase family)
VSARVLVVGDAMLDVIVQPMAPVAPTSDTPANVRLSRGGAAANVAVALASFGLEVHYVGVIGDDPYGLLFADDLARNGVTVQLAKTRGPTGVVVALIAPDGQRSMLTDRGVNGLLTIDAVRSALGQPFDHLHVSGYTLLDERTRDAGTSAIALAREREMTTSVDVCSVGPLATVTAPTFLQAAIGATMLFANEEEAMMLAGTGDVYEAATLLARHFEEVLVTRGREGALVAQGAQLWHEDSQSLDVLDTTGAGDAASGAYLAARLADAEIEPSLAQAMGAAAAVVRGFGSRGQSRL